MNTSGYREYLGLKELPKPTNFEILGKIYLLVNEMIKAELYPKAFVVVLFAYIGPFNLGIDPQELEYSKEVKELLEGEIIPDLSQVDKVKQLIEDILNTSQYL